MQKFTLLFLVLISSFTLKGQNITVPQTQKGVVTKLAATWCPICGGTAWDAYKRMVADNGTNALVLTAHRSNTSRLYSATAEILYSQFETVVSQPWFFFNNSIVGRGDGSTEADAKKAVGDFGKITPTVQSGIQATYTPANRELSVTVKSEFFKDATGDFTVGVYLIEKSVVSEQSTRTANETHLNVLRTHFGNNVLGSALSSGNTAKGFNQTFTTKLTVPQGINIANARVATIIWRAAGQRSEVVNSNWTDQVAGVSTRVVENAALKAAFKLSPNILESETQVSFKLPKAAKNIKVEVFNTLGQNILTLYRGALGAGAQQLPLSRAQVPAKGLYFIRLEADGEFAIQELIVQ